MSNLYQRRYLNVPYCRAKELLADTVQAAATSGNGELLRLRLPVSDGATLTKDVTVAFGRGADPMHFDQPWTVQWQPSTHGIYPSFSGTLTVRADETYDTAVLELAGTYEPPLGAAGAAFDVLIGSRIAHATALELLGRIGAGLEERYRREEAAKPVVTTAVSSDE